MQRRTKLISNIDWWTILLYLGLCIFGWINISGASYSYDHPSLIDFSTVAGKQLIWLGGALLLGGIILLLDHKIYDTAAYFAYAAVLVLLIITRFFPPVKGSYSWISFSSSFRLQPAEFAKLTTALALAKFMGQYDYRLRSWRDLIKPLIILGIPAMIIMVWENETGSALVFAAFMLVFYRQGMSGYVLLCGIAAVALFILAVKYSDVPIPIGTGTVGMLSCMLLLLATGIFFVLQENRYRMEKWIITGTVAGLYGLCLLINIWVPVNFNWVSLAIVVLLAIYLIVANLYKRNPVLVMVGVFMLLSVAYTNGCNYIFHHVLRDHQRSRIELILGMRDDPHGVGYNVNQAQIAITTGRFWGKGWHQGTQTQMKFVPEQATDFIFSTVGEEWGFVGTAGVLVFYLIFILRLIHIAERQKDNFARIYGYSVASIFLLHLTINIGMVLGVLPVIGIPLPFFSYGGSSLWGFTMLLFILLRLDAAGAEQMR
ncbi:MAG: rod shape-determining protein RodA [Paludibacteraceae bacterium]|nr:rod shape-determining protein RodA [Paludibacteraceae bacterium]